jgi:hypothetical protein
MKTIVRNDNNISLYLFADDKFVDVQTDKIVVGNPPELIIADCNSNNATLFEGVTNPKKWTGWKYFYTDGDGWVLNPDWVDPNAPNA